MASFSTGDRLWMVRETLTNSYQHLRGRSSERESTNREIRRAERIHTAVHCGPLPNPSWMRDDTARSGLRTYHRVRQSAHSGTGSSHNRSAARRSVVRTGRDMAITRWVSKACKGRQILRANWTVWQLDRLPIGRFLECSRAFQCHRKLDAGGSGAMDGSGGCHTTFSLIPRNRDVRADFYRGA